MAGKVPLLDGTVISGTSNFYAHVMRIFQVAKENAPSVIFIDDTDAIFESGEELGLYRYLLTMLDGLESEGHSRVCVMMTAMDVGHLPPALVRSGRIELWLEMRLPEADSRRQILAEKLAALRPPLNAADVDVLVGASEGFTGADLKRGVEDGKTLYAYDRSRGREPGDVTGYFLRALETVQQNRSRYEEAQALARQQRPNRASHYFDVGAAMAMAAAAAMNEG